MEARLGSHNLKNGPLGALATCALEKSRYRKPRPAFKREWPVTPLGQPRTIVSPAPYAKQSMLLPIGGPPPTGTAKTHPDCIRMKTEVRFEPPGGLRRGFFIAA